MFIYKEEINHVQVRRRTAQCLYIKKRLTMFKYGEGLHHVLYKEGINHVQVRRRTAPCLYIKKGLIMIKYGEGLHHVYI